ncbi:CBS domain-containing protein [Prosthecomicrobium sp. N25]|uniref:CBS domain-containing protein n=1 Tax=Prosthecomicrobium sp. N25 TaxID=3129254 RepID=UPI003076A98E
MKAKDVMTTGVVTVKPDTSVSAIATLLLERHISAVPVVDDLGTLLGIVSEGDLIRRAETGTDRKPSWWLELLRTPEDKALAYVKSHGRRADEVMTRDVVTVEEDTSLRDIARLLEERRIKRVPVVKGGHLVGIVSRADLLRGLVTAQQAAEASADDEGIRRSILERVRSDAGVVDTLLNVTVAAGIVHLWGSVDTPGERRAVHVVAENTPGVKEVVDHLRVLRG